MTPEQEEIIRQCAHEYPNINGLVPSPENAEAIEEFLDDWGLKLDGDTAVLAEPEYEGSLLVVYMPWCVSGELSRARRVMRTSRSGPLWNWASTRALTSSRTA
jgi:hypothetical protein